MEKLREKTSIGRTSTFHNLYIYINATTLYDDRSRKAMLWRFFHFVAPLPVINDRSLGSVLAPAGTVGCGNTVPRGSGWGVRGGSGWGV